MKLTRLLPALLLFSLPVIFAEEAKQKTPIETDLVLSAKLKSAKTIQPGEAIDISLSLTNSSKSATHRVIKPGDGSSDGRRPPYIQFSVQHLDDDGAWTEAPRQRLTFCGIYDFDWMKDFVDLTPGESLELNTWLTAVHRRYDLQKPGQYRIRAVYDYPVRSDKLGAKEKLPATIRDIPPFRVSSGSILITVERPLDVRLKVKRNLIAKEETALTDVFDLTLTNVSDRKIEVSSPTLHADACIVLEVEGKLAGTGTFDFNHQADIYGIKQAIKPKETLSLLGNSQFANGLNGTWTYPLEETVKVRASYYLSTWKPAPIIKSDWVEVEVKQNQQKLRMPGDGANRE